MILHFPCAGFLFLIAVTLFINDNNIINMIYLKKVLNYNHQWSLCLPWKLEIQVALSAIFFMKTLRHETPTKVYICDIRWVSFSIFPWTQSILNLEIKRRLNFNDYLWQAIFKIFQIWTKCARLKWISSLFLFLIWNICKQSTLHL